MKKQYIIRKYVMAESIEEALKKEKKITADECWVSEQWLQNNTDFNEVGFKTKAKIHI